MSLSLNQNKNFVDSFFKMTPLDLDKKHRSSPQHKFYEIFKLVNSHHSKLSESNETQISIIYAIVNEMNDSFQKSYNDLHLLAVTLIEFKKDKRTCFKAAKKIISLGMNINSAFIIRHAPGRYKYMSSLDLALHTISSPSLVALLVIHGAACVWKASNRKEKFAQGLDPLFNRMKILIISKTDQESILFKLLPKEMISEIAYKQLWVEAHTFREQIV